MLALLQVSFPSNTAAGHEFNGSGNTSAIVTANTAPVSQGTSYHLFSSTRSCTRATVIHEWPWQGKTVYQYYGTQHAVFEVTTKLVAVRSYDFVATGKLPMGHVDGVKGEDHRSTTTLTAAFCNHGKLRAPNGNRESYEFRLWSLGRHLQTHGAVAPLFPSRRQSGMPSSLTEQMIAGAPMLKTLLQCVKKKKTDALLRVVCPSVPICMHSRLLLQLLNTCAGAANRGWLCSEIPTGSTVGVPPVAGT